MKPFPARHWSLDVCDITTVGRRSGRHHIVEIWFAIDESTLYVLAGLGERCDWLRNLDANPAVTVEVGGDRRHGRACRVTDPDERRRFGDLMNAKYPDYEGETSIGLTRTTWLYEVPAVAIDDWRPA